MSMLVVMVSDSDNVRLLTVISEACSFSTSGGLQSQSRLSTVLLLVVLDGVRFSLFSVSSFEDFI